MTDSLLVGRMSGTSMDGIDAALVRINNQRIELIDCLESPLPAQLREEISTLSHPGENEIERMGRLDRKLGLLCAQSCLDLLRQSGIDRRQIRAIGSHGQTVRHHPPSASHGGEPCFTLQIGDPNTIAEITGITTVADFRRRDIAAGGEGAPLVPAFHQQVFAAADISRAIVNIGGIANISLLSGADTLGFDSGPGNTLLDHWIASQRGQSYDAGGSWGAEGEVDQSLLQQLLTHPYFDQPLPKSTGKEVFNPDWLEQQLSTLPPLEPRDVQATLAEFTAASIALGLDRCGEIDEVYVCGGGAANADLMRRLFRHVAPAKLGSTAELGCDPAWVEAAAFAWLAQQRLESLPGNLATATGAAGPRILGAIYPGAE